MRYRNLPKLSAMLKFIHLKASLFIVIVLCTIQVSAQGPCEFINFTLEHYEPCKFRLHIDNSTECYPELRLVIDAGTYESFQANMSSGWTCTKISPTELLVKHNSGKVPIGASIPLTFVLEPGFNPLFSILWDNVCALLGCVYDLPLEGCPIIADAGIIGTKYRECDQAIFSNQTTLSNFTINLFDNNGLLLASTVTDSLGQYGFYDLPAGQYFVREPILSGWTPNIPATGQYNVTLQQSEIVTRNFGNCPVCSCDSIYIDLVESGENSDTCFYTLVTRNTGGYCFQKIVIAKTVKGSKSNSDNRILEPGWTINQIDSQNLELFPPSDFIPTGVTFPLQISISGSEENTFTVTTHYLNGGMQKQCKKDFSFKCPRVRQSADCCPVGSSVQGPERIFNNNFDQGYASFISGSSYNPPGFPLGPHFFTIAKASEVPLANPLWLCNDNTTGSSTGKFAIFDDWNYAGLNKELYRTVVNSLQVGREYYFSAYVNNLTIPTYNLDDPIIELWIYDQANTFQTKLASVIVPESPDTWLLICGTYKPPTSGHYVVEIRNSLISSKGNDIAIDDVTFKECIEIIDTCNCGLDPYDLSYSIGRGPLVPYDCGDTLTVPASQSITPIQFSSFFKCGGSNCPPSANIDLLLTGPAGFIPITITGIQAIPGFVIPFTNTTFTLQGLYTLTIIGHCGTDLCPCTIYFNAAGHNCCKNRPDFELAILNAVSISIDKTKCKATLNIGNLPKCDSITNISWGDNNFSPGVFGSGTMPMHTYSGSGVYVISWLALEYDNTFIPPRICFEKIFSDTIRLSCDSCACKSFSSMVFANFNWTKPNIPVSCGQNSIQLPCIYPGENFWLHGFMNCNTQICMQDSLNWTLAIMNGPIISSGTNYINPSNGHFDIYLNPILFNSNVPYQIIVTGNCGNKLCKCAINFSFPACPCPCDSLQIDVAQGFFVSGNPLSCSRTIKPKGLCSNDIVTWVITPPITPTPGNTIGNNSQVFNFSTPGVYHVCMHVAKPNPNLFLDTCKEFYCRNVIVNCFPNPVIRLCKRNTIKNGDFIEGRIEGHMELNSGGKIDDWRLFPNTGDGLVFVTDSSGASDDGSVILMGNKNNFAGIWQQVDLASDNYINIGFDVIDYRRNRLLDHLLAYDIVFRLQSDSTLRPNSSVEILRKAGKEKKDEKERAYHRFDTSIAFQHNPELKYLVLCLQNQSDSSYSVIGIDNIEICTSKIPLSTYTEQAGKFRIYPNPNNGHFTIEMQQSFSSAALIRIIDITGRRILEKRLDIESRIQNIDASILDSGLYFIQVIDKAKLIGVKTIIKM